MVVSNLQVAVINETLVVLRHAAAHAVETHRDRVRTLRPEDRAVLAIVGDAPETGLRRDQSLVAVVIIGEGFRRLRDVNLVSCCRDEVTLFFSTSTYCLFSRYRVGFEIGETTGGRVVEEVTAKVVGTEAEGRVLVDRNRRIGIGFATNRRVAGSRARCILVEVVGLVSRGLGFALLVVGCRRTAVADRVVVKVFREAGDGLAVFGATRRSQLAARVVGVGVDGARKIAEGGASFGDCSAATCRVVCIIELGDDVGGRGVADLDELVVRVVGPAGGESIRISQRRL